MNRVNAGGDDNDPSKMELRKIIVRRKGKKVISQRADPGLASPLESEQLPTHL